MHAKIIIVCVMLYKYYYFRFNIKTINGEKEKEKTLQKKTGGLIIFYFSYIKNMDNLE